MVYYCFLTPLLQNTCIYFVYFTCILILPVCIQICRMTAYNNKYISCILYFVLSLSIFVVVRCLFYISILFRETTTLYKAHCLNVIWLVTSIICDFYRFTRNSTRLLCPVMLSELYISSQSSQF